MAYEIQKGYGVGFKVAGIDSEQLDKAIKKPWASDGKNFSDRIWSKKTQMVDTLHGEIIRSMLTGGNTKEAISIMQKYVRNDVKNAKYAAARLIRTESAYFASEGQKKCFNDLDVEKYEIVATLDNRTSDICQGMDGQVFEMKDFETGVTAPPFHVNCRSTTAPYFDDEFAKGERAARGADGETYYVPSDMTYKEWKEKQDDLKNDKEEKKEPNVIRFNDITDKWTEKTKEGSYAECDSITVNGKTYKVGDNGVYLNTNARSKEIEIANILYEKYGKDIVLLPELAGDNRNIHMPDLMVDGKLTEIKSITGTGKNTIKHNLSEAKKQAKDVILNIANDKIDVDNAIKTVERLFNDKQCDFMDSCILMKDGEIIKVLERNKIGTRNLQKQGVIPIINNITTKPIKSQLKSDEKDGKINIFINNINNAKTIEEINSIATEHFVNKEGCNISEVKLDGIDIDIAKEVVIKADDLTDRFKTTLVGIKSDDLERRTDGETRITEASAQKCVKLKDSKYLQSNIALSKKLHSDKQNIEQQYLANKSSEEPFLVVVNERNKYISTFVHEFGHSILPGKANEILEKNGCKINKVVAECKKIWEEYKNKCQELAKPRISAERIGDADALKKAYADIRNYQVSIYSREPFGEFIAECFEDFELSDTPKEISKKLYNILVKEFGK